jgi:hypothetical protein
MSIQSVIDLSLSEEGGYMRTVVVRGEEGDVVTLPDLCAVHLIDCKVKQMVVGTQCTVTIVRSEIETSLLMLGGTLTMEEVNVLPGAVLTLEGTKARQAKCTGEVRTVLTQKAVLEAVGNVRVGAGSETAITAEDSRVEISDDTFENFEKCLSLDQGSRGNLRNVEMTGLMDGLSVAAASGLEMFGCKVRAEDGVAISVDGFSKLWASYFPENLYGRKNALLVTDNSKVEIQNTQDFESEETIILVEGSSRLEITNFGDVTTDLGSSLRCVESEVYLRNGGKFETLKQVCVSVQNGSLYCQDIERIFSRFNFALWSQQVCTVRLLDMEREVHSWMKTAIQGSDGDTYEILNVPVIKGGHGDAIRLGSSASLHAQGITEIIGTVNPQAPNPEVVAHALNLGSNCKIRLQDISLLRGVVFAGINAGSGLHLTALDVDEITGTLGAGIKAESGATIRCKDIVEVKGLEGAGIEVGSGSDIEVQGFSQVWGSVNSLVAPSSKVVLLDGGSVLAPVLGGAVVVDGSGGQIIARNLASISAFEGDGVRISGGSVELLDIPSLTGGVNGINASGSSVQSTNVAQITGGINGVSTMSGSRATIISSIISGLAIALNADGSEVRAVGCSLVGGAISIQAVEEAVVICSSTTADGTVEGSGGGGDASVSVIVLRGFTFTTADVTTCCLVLEGGSCTEITALQSSLQVMNLQATTITLDDCGASLLNVIATDLDVSNGGAVVAGGSMAAAVASGGCISALKSEMAPDLTAAGLVTAGQGKVEIAHDVKVLIESADIETKELV